MKQVHTDGKGTASAAERIAATKQSFEAAFAEQQFYAKQTQDAAHLQQILDFLPVTGGMRILDLGAGSGYLTFALAERFPDAAVTGLDIVEHALETCRAKAEAAQIGNIRFVSYDGTVFPFADGAFNLVVSRYSLHHFPDIRKSISEVGRVLTEKGYFFLSDPTPNGNDSARFIDAFMQMKPDGHVQFYTADAWKQLCTEQGLAYLDAFRSSIRFPRKHARAYQELIAQYSREITDGYALQIDGDEIYVTEQVNNMLFRKKK